MIIFTLFAIVFFICIFKLCILNNGLLGLTQSVFLKHSSFFSLLEQQAIAGHILDFFEHEVKRGRLPPNLLPLQSGVGNIANAVIAGLTKGPYENVSVWTEVLQDTMLDFFDSGKLKFASTAALSLSKEGFERFYANMDEYKEKILIRPQQITNHPELIRRLGVIAMNTPLEVDIYGHANSTHVLGTRMMHGIGGSGDFLRSGHISIVHTPSARPSTRSGDPTALSCIVPMCSHVDHTEHDIQIIVTEQGLADVRGVTPRKRAEMIINNCAHPDYKDKLMEYLRRSEKECLRKKTAHQPHMLRNSLRMHLDYIQKGSMKTEWLE